MSLVNIPSYKEDSNYRYKMPRIRCKIEGSGNGIRTNFINIGDVSKALKRPPEYLVKYLGCELCVQARFIGKEQKGIFQGKHSEQELTAMVDRFIESYVLCPKCELPEIDLFVKSKLVHGMCNACGTECKLNSIHRVAALIIKNPPVLTTVGSSKKKKDKDVDEVNGNENIDIKKDANRRRRVKKDSVIIANGENGDIPTTEKKRVRKRKKKVEGYGLRADEGNNIVCRLQELQKRGVEPRVYFNELRSLQLARNFSNADRVYLGMKGFLKRDDDVTNDTRVVFGVEEMANMIPYLELFGADDSVDPDDLLSGFLEYLYYEVDQESYAKLPLHLKKLYDERFLDEVDILTYFDSDQGSGIFTSALKTASPLLEWFRNAADSNSEYDASDEYDNEDNA